jgi:hypothetical protein
MSARLPLAPARASELQMGEPELPASVSENAQVVNVRCFVLKYPTIGRCGLWLGLGAGNCSCVFIDAPPPALSAGEQREEPPGFTEEDYLRKDLVCLFERFFRNERG